jgi:hypothetical protein
MRQRKSYRVPITAATSRTLFGGDDWGERVQVFVGCAKTAGGDAKMADYFVFPSLGRER